VADAKATAANSEIQGILDELQKTEINLKPALLRLLGSALADAKASEENTRRVLYASPTYDRHQFSFLHIPGARIPRHRRLVLT